MEWHREELIVSDQVSMIDVDTVSKLLSTTYWAADRQKETIQKTIENSICFGLYHSRKQIGFARVVSDKAVFSWLLDVVIAEEYRRQGTGQWLMEYILSHPEIKSTKFALATSDAQDFYRKFDFKENNCMTRA